MRTNIIMLAVLKWFEHDECVYFTSYDTFYIENKTWHNDVSSCKTKYPAVLMMLPTATVTVELLFICADGNSIPAVYRCDDGIDCENGDDEDNCFQVCSTHANCTTGCLSPACVCMPLYHQCLRGGCVHWSFVCDGVVNCAYDDSDELMCNYQLQTPSHSRKSNYQQFSLCNSFTNETFPNLELCLLVRDQYGVTKHCNNTEHLHYCVDFSCPNHYKCSFSYCIPMHLVCDGVKDCPQGEDEEQCNEFVCQGFMRCKGMSMCLHPNYVCNGVIECTLYGDDEVFCDSRGCPTQCECVGLTIFCDKVTVDNLNSYKIYKMKAIIFVDSAVYFEDMSFASLSVIHLLNLSNSKITPQLDPSSFRKMMSLQILDLTNVNIEHVGESAFIDMSSLTHMYLPRIQVFAIKSNIFLLPSLLTLQLHAAGIQTVENDAFCYLFKLNMLNISNNRIKTISTNTFSCLRFLKLLDLSGNPLNFIATSAFKGIGVVSVSRRPHYCCIIAPTSRCKLDLKILDTEDVSKHCQPIFINVLVKTFYISIGIAFNLFSIILTIKLITKKHSEITKVTPYVKAIMISESFNGIFISTVFVSDLLIDFWEKNILHVVNISEILYLLGVIPRMALLLSRLQQFLLTIQMYLATCHVFKHYDENIKRFSLILSTACIVYCAIDATLLRHFNQGNSVTWLPYQLTDHSVSDILSVILIIVFDTITCVVILILYIQIYQTVSMTAKRVQTKRVKKNALIAKRLVRLTLGRVTIYLFSTSLILLLTFEQHLSTFMAQLGVVLELPVSFIVNILLFYE